MNRFRETFLVITYVYSFFVFIFLAEYQRVHLGARAGNLLWLLEALIAGSVYVGYRLFRRGKSSKAIAVAWFAGAISVAFLGWLVHPEQVYKRPFDRKTYINRYLTSKATDDSMRRVLIEQSALDFEIQATEYKFNSDPEFYKSSFSTWSLYGLAIVFFANGAIAFLGRKDTEQALAGIRRKEQS